MTSINLSRSINNKAHEISASHVIPVSTSDHYFVYGIIKQLLFKGQPKFIETRNMKIYDPELFISELRNVPWNLIKPCEDPHDMVFV